MAEIVTFNDRVLDVIRSALSNGTEMPVVRSDRFSRNRIVLLGVPIGGNFRSTLRIYAAHSVMVTFTIAGEQHAIQLQPGPSMFEPAYASFSEFPIPIDPGSPTTVRVTVDAPLVVVGPSPILEPIWAFITSTNNNTQQITTITPD